MTRILMVGFGPLPDDPLQRRVSASGLRTWHFLSVLRAAGHDICLIAGRDFGIYPDDAPDVISRSVPGSDLSQCQRYVLAQSGSGSHVDRRVASRLRGQCDDHGQRDCQRVDR